LSGGGAVFCAVTACATSETRYGARVTLPLRTRTSSILLGLSLLAASASAAAPELDQGYLKLGFDRLASYKFVQPPTDPVTDGKSPPTGEEQIPSEVKGWSNQKAVVTGFMLPTKLENGKATEFLLMANQMACCYGTVPNMNEWIVVKMPQGTPVTQDVPLSFYGTLKIGAMFENGYMTGIYEFDAERQASMP
jgi:hypothetical protein